LSLDINGAMDEVDIDLEGWDGCLQEVFGMVWRMWLGRRGDADV
jgi:hypothetical protein